MEARARAARGGTHMARMEVGINYPSGPGPGSTSYGWDFGVPPPGWGPAQWKTVLPEDLKQFRDIGFVAVRWFILGDGLTYGTPRDGHAPQLQGGQWRFDPPASLDGSHIVEDFQLALEGFRLINAQGGPPLRLLPSLIDFLAFKAGNPAGNGWVKSGRADIVRDEVKRKRFFQTVLTPLVELTWRPEYRNLIYGWELINEPEWVTHTGTPDPDRQISVEEMRTFIREGAALINALGYDAHARRGFFRSTVGFAMYPTLFDRPAFQDTYGVWRSAGWNSTALGLTLHQFHHYALPPVRQGNFHVANPAGRLVQNAFDARWPCILGEIATGPDNNPWPELPLQDIHNRLAYAEHCGYPATFVWSARRPAEDDVAGGPTATLWTPRIREQIRRFIRGDVNVA